MASIRRIRFPASLFVSILLHLVLAILLFQTVIHEYKEEEFITLDWVKLPPAKRVVKTEAIKRPQPKTDDTEDFQYPEKSDSILNGSRLR